ncbi:MAG: DUF4293 domain-containing protein [Taibaiella sp.]|nr:DUF4293 domain-containing protein [Taibaiella sp.]
MIQRKQSIWLLLTALFNSGLLVFDLYRWHETVNGADVVQSLRVTNHYPSLMIALVLILLPLVNLFMYTQRKRQMAMTAFNMVAVAGFVAMLLGRVGHTITEMPAAAAGTYWVGAVLPVITILFLILAIAGIRKDEKLVQSMDRLR